MTKKCKPIKPIFESKSKDKVYSIWLSILNKIENYTVSSGADQNEIEKSRNLSMDIIYIVFPLIDSITLHLFNKQNKGEYYLQKLGYPKNISKIVFSMFRNGFIHNNRPYKIEYLNGSISWSLFSTSGNTGFHKFDKGYIDTKNPEFNVPSESAISLIKNKENDFNCFLNIDRLVAQMKFDLEERKNNDKRENIEFIVGVREDKNIPLL